MIIFDKFCDYLIISNKHFDINMFFQIQLWYKHDIKDTKKKEQIKTAK